MLREKDMEVLADCALFRGIAEAEMPDALRWLNAADRAYREGELLLLAGDTVERAGVVLEGAVSVSFLDESDNNVGMNRFAQGELFGEALAYLGGRKSPVQLQAVTRCRVLFFDFQNVLSAQLFDAGYQAMLASNLLRLFAQKSFFLNQKLRIVSQRRLRDRIKLYLRMREARAGGTVELPFLWGDLAEFLCVNRYALSRELSRMEEDGIIEVSGRSIRVLDGSFLRSGDFDVRGKNTLL